MSTCHEALCAVAGSSAVAVAVDAPDGVADSADAPSRTAGGVSDCTISNCTDDSSSIGFPPLYGQSPTDDSSTMVHDLEPKPFAAQRSSTHAHTIVLNA